jgi:uncharacterized protein
MSEKEAELQFVLSGASGLLGSALASLLSAKGHRVLRLVRRTAKSDTEIEWDPAKGSIDKSRLEGTDVFIHLSGENVGEGRWTDERKKVLISSRTETTGLLARTIAEMDRKPRRFVCASAIGYYGDQRTGALTESAGKGDGFLAEVCDLWERAAEPARKAGVETVHMRIGVVLSREGGALEKLLPVFKLGVGGPVGSGHQVMSWISLADAVRAFHFVSVATEMSGPVNVVSPNPSENATLAKTLGRILKRPAFMRVPALAVDVLFGQMGRETVLASQRVVPERLLAAGFAFEHPDLEDALRAALS